MEGPPVKSLSKTINEMLRRVGLHISRDSSFRGLQSELARTQAHLTVLRAQQERQNEFERSQERWRADEPDAGLTWGVRMDGDAFVRFLLQHVTLKDTSTIVEIGPGYGRILEALLKSGAPFRRYIGLEISAARVARLSSQFKDRRIEFRQADVLGRVELNAIADLTFSSAVFEHLYPDFSAAIDTISHFTRQGGSIIIDFVRDEASIERSEFFFETNGTYIRFYSSQDLKNVFAKSGFTIDEIGKISFGHDIHNREITRTIAVATKGDAAGRALESVATGPTASTIEVKPFDILVHRYPAPCDHLSLEPPVIPQFRTAFGGLWTDLNTADSILAGKIAISEMTTAEASLVAHWRRYGFVILRGAINADAIDAALSDFERAYDGVIRRKMLFADDKGSHIEIANREYIRKENARLLDLHEISEAVQAIVFAEPLSRFLQILFERPALAFQSLGFYYGSAQPAHQDCAFVRVSSPFEFVASWIALEDIAPDSGELEYYPGSHALPPYIFNGKYLWVDYSDPELPQLSQNLHARAKQAGLAMQRFLAKKGDVLVWSPGLIHGGSKIMDPNRTRKSLVTHYCPADQQPMYTYKGGRPKHKSISGNYVMAEPWE
jgi:ectoine hydroxylase-related dioxygenase (phytanoyl-CoA dioxygenase family)/SAM-dependent methyltransferase